MLEPDAGRERLDAAISIDTAPPQVVPSNGGPLQSTGLAIAPPNGAFSTTTDCVTPSVLGACEVVDQSDGSELCACRADRFTIGTLRVTGTRALVLLAFDEVIVGGTLDVGGDRTTNGPGASRDYATTATSLTGGAGGSYGTSGGGSAAMAFGDPALVPLLGGMRGQDACNSTRGGGGGGALQITAGGAITVSGTILAGGGGGNGGGSGGTCVGGPGGGSGGAILLEAPVVTVTGTVAASGGGGGGGGSNDFGSGGVAGNGARTGGLGGSGNDNHGCALQGYTVGGDGGRGGELANGGNGASSDSVSGCLGGTILVGAGGGGGGGGRIRVNTSSGCQCAGTFTPAPSIGTVEIR